MRYNIAQDYRAMDIAEYQWFYNYDYATASAIVTMEELLQAVAKRKCKAEGHKLKDISCIGPESGKEEIYCTRCGWSSTWIYY